MFINTQHQLAYETMTAGNYAHAIKLYTRCIASHPMQATLFSERAVCYIHTQEPTKSLADFDLSVELEPNYAYRFSSRGHAKDYFGDLDGAIKDYEKALELEPNDAIVNNNLGLLLEKKGSITQAKEHYDRSDKLRKAEDQLHQVLDDIENPESNPATTQVDASYGELEDYEDSKKETIWTVITDLLQSKTARKEFVSFIRNGFKIKKKND